MELFSKRSRLRAAVAAVAGATLLVTGCGEQASEGGGGERPQIGVAEINLSLPFFVEMQEASQNIADDYGVDVAWQSVDGSIETQISTIESFIAQQKDVILIDPVNADALVDVINRATAEGIDVVTMGNKVPADENHNTLYPDYDNWVQQARILGTELGGEGKVLLLIGSVGNYVSDTRQEAFETTMAEEFPGIEIITQPTNFDSSEAGSVTQTVLTNNPDLAGIASISDGLTLAAIKVVEQQGLDIPFVSNDGDQTVYEYIDSGVILSNILTGSYRVGAWNTAAAARMALGSEFETDLFMPTYTIASEGTAAGLAEEGLELETITTAEASEIAQQYAEEFGSEKSDADMTVGSGS
ncbi:sugar ABC transporter substrate-binding protein (plasmid) [Arthrobacter sp. zg-Y820]|uniref:sugar ABC transporter substrate-binding protein n=1 Tax=unclassified Arthrobacter TaxID=235627 RepID=UPI001E326BA0|nr:MULTISPECIES: sugar ABC transporter substrate-binding protein [unclassified Arthrobacter]MCC9198513.1 sugar ABC transporter substrate-binding protein [Arthrobacter sp. zg-Y820]MDK1281383.1 sugar ABC transporter substrate-binding protein [Arthrobacter sp. zg.Y820]WIB11270.1 sugar ABC transporter substrate-binding protein [Arthrobacter sp. zg-Y820]